MPNFLESVLEFPAISRVRRNHGLEHATLHVLAQRFPHLAMAGHSNTGGFVLVGDVPTEAVKQAVQEALRRLNGGEPQLAVHPNCGTNFVVSGTMAGLAGAAVMMGPSKRWREKLERLPMAISLATLALIIAQPLGLLLQERVTTSGAPGAMEVVEITSVKNGQMTMHRVTTRG